MACSSDGTVAYIEFNKDEIGDPMAQNDVVSILQRWMLLVLRSFILPVLLIQYPAWI